MEWIADPSIWAGLITLVVLELVLGIDNLVFIAILADKLPPEQRDRARVVGLALALFMRLLLLTTLSWLSGLTRPLFTLMEHAFSLRDLIMLTGGVFLLFKATVELSQRLEAPEDEEPASKNRARFWPVVAQIVVLDAIFSLDAVITAIGMVKILPVMIAAVTIAIFLMILASKPLTRFINAHQSIIILCLSFLLMIGLSLVAEGFGFHIPKGYIYAAIGFSLLIESFNQLARYKRKRSARAGLPLRRRTAEVVLRLLRERHDNPEEAPLSPSTTSVSGEESVFNQQEQRMIARVLGMAQRGVNTIMTSRHDTQQIDLATPTDNIIQQLNQNQHTRLIVMEDGGEPLGIVHVIDLKRQLLSQSLPDLRALVRQPLVFPEKLSLLQALEQFRLARTHFAFVVDEFGSVEGIVTLSDIMESIAGDLPDEIEEVSTRQDIEQSPNGDWIVNGYTSLDELALNLPLKLDEKREYHTVAGLLMEHLQRIPCQGEEIVIGDYVWCIMQIDHHRIQRVRVSRDTSSSDF